jgi:hypothetical protein
MCFVLTSWVNLLITNLCPKNVAISLQRLALSIKLRGAIISLPIRFHVYSADVSYIVTISGVHNIKYQLFARHFHFLIIAPTCFLQDSGGET